MKTIKDQIRSYLVEDIRFRERSNKYKGIVNLLFENHPLLAQIPRDKVIEYLIEASSMNRIWNRILQEEPELRGSDYEDKIALEQEAETALGYH